jgi:hypothetical protein
VSDPKKDEIATLVEQTIEGLIEEALVVGDTGRMEFDLAGARGVITKVLSDYEALRPDPVEAFYVAVNARAEAEMLNGKPVTGAHHRALEAEILAYRKVT